MRTLGFIFLSLSLNNFIRAEERLSWFTTDPEMKRSIFVPDSVNLLGTTVHSQAAVLDLSNPLGITISNRVAATIGN